MLAEDYDGEYPCEFCPQRDPLWFENIGVWNVFAECAQKHEWDDKEKQKHIQYEIRWERARVQAEVNDLTKEDMRLLLRLESELGAALKNG